MKKVLVFSFVCVSLAFLGMIDSAAARSSYGSNVDSFCLDSNPFGGNCLLCHTSSSKADPTSAIDAYLAGDLCYFCPDDAACGPACPDKDGDGYLDQACGGADCNDNDAAMNPGQVEICSDNKDNDCNGAIDQQDPVCGVPPTCTDGDGDGFSVEGGVCGPVDCDDYNADINPGATDICNDGIDQDCSGADRAKGKGCKTTTTAGKEGKGGTCSDGIDNDGNGLVDCADTACARNRACR